ncbi:hypothetical protein B0H10DRAFT_1852403, partial [Mycena sp. CBHHK59/15]
QKNLPTSLPKLQLAIIMLIQICEPLTSQLIYPYVTDKIHGNTLIIVELDIMGGDERKVGYYARVSYSELSLLFLRWCPVVVSCVVIFFSFKNPDELISFKSPSTHSFHSFSPCQSRLAASGCPRPAHLGDIHLTATALPLLVIQNRV